ncbi:Farnesoate epoxidase [Orchesella cincta]|uniref:Farnesoate epoxidase n=1 Tax=Orchesella cincta TaxID=48709 RepID=A0A1D2MD66_ORCCI|nr:Farnesoate epoxidase [Orchesella cincta]
MFLMFLVFATTGCALYLWLLSELSESKTRLPGPMQFPLVGSMIQVITTHPVGFIAIDKLSQIYGDAMSIKLGIVDCVFVSSYESVKYFYGGENCVDRPGTGIWLERQFYKKIRVLSANGPSAWGEMRKFITQSWSSCGPMNRDWLRGILKEEVTSFLKYVEELASSSPGRVVPFKASGFVKVSFTNLLTATLVGKRHENYGDKKLLGLVAALDKFFRASRIGISVMTAYPWLRFLFGRYFGYHTQLESVAGIHKYSKELISQRRKLGVYKNGEPTCFIDAFLQRIESEKENAHLFSNEALLVTLADFYTAGTETSSNWLLFAILLLMTHPEKQEKLYQELRVKVGNRPIELEDRNELIYTQAVILEVFRWGKVTVNLESRQAIRDFEYNGRIVKKGTTILANMCRVYNTPNVWKDPQVFRPERFINEDGQLIKEKAERIIPFGLGKRICLGEMLAKDSGFMYLTTLVQKYRFELPHEYLRNPPSLELIEGITTCVADYNAKLVKRETNTQTICY